jgi:hypothetical protein
MLSWSGACGSASGGLLSCLGVRLNRSEWISCGVHSILGNAAGIACLVLSVLYDLAQNLTLRHATQLGLSSVCISMHPTRCSLRTAWIQQWSVARPEKRKTSLSVRISWTTFPDAGYMAGSISTRVQRMGGLKVKRMNAGACLPAFQNSSSLVVSTLCA